MGEGTDTGTDTDAGEGTYIDADTDGAKHRKTQTSYANEQTQSDNSTKPRYTQEQTVNTWKHRHKQTQTNRMQTRYTHTFPELPDLGY